MDPLKLEHDNSPASVGSSANRARKNQKSTAAIFSDKLQEILPPSGQNYSPLTKVQRQDKSIKAKISSEFLAEMTMSLQDRLALCGKQSKTPQIIKFEDIGENSYNKETIVPVDQPLFHCVPSTVIFQDYKPFETYEAIISFRNRDKVARRLKIKEIDSPIFSLSAWKSGPSNGSRIAPGMEICYIIKFKPEAIQDYACELICTTDREKFVVPVQALGMRGIIDFPDEVSFEESAVKYAKTKSIFVRNIGNAPARYRIECPKPFSVEPRQSVIQAQENSQLIVTFNPQKIDSFREVMTVIYESGERVSVRLTGVAEDVPIRLETEKVKLEDTYLSLASSRTVRLYNDSNIVTKFQWKMFKSDEEDERHRLQKLTELDREEINEEKKLYESFGLIDFGMGLNTSLINKRYLNLKRTILADPLLFNQAVFQIEPIQGEIWPNSFVDITIIFEPKIARHYIQPLFCDVSGKQERLSLTVDGIGIGPKARFPYDCLDVETVFINSAHEYEVVLENRGGIDVVYNITPKQQSIIASKFQFYPSSGVVGLDQAQKIKITFAPDFLGSFQEEFVCSMEGSEDQLNLTFRGEVIGPTFHFSADYVDFGKISYGFPVSRTVSLFNTSEINMRYSLRLSESVASGSPIISEFGLDPKSGNIGPGQQQEITIHLHPMQERYYDIEVVVDISSVGESIYRLPVKANCLIPKVYLKHSSIDLGDCFLNYTYESEVILINDSTLPAYFEFSPGYGRSENEIYCFQSKKMEGVIEAKSETTVPFNVIYKRLGAIHIPIFIGTRGRENQPLELLIGSFSIGPTVTISSDKVDFGKVNVLQTVTSVLQLRNESLIEAKFLCEPLSPSSVFSLNPTQGVLEPKATVDILVSAFLDDHSRFSETLKIGVQDSGISEVSISAKGSGSTVWFDEELKRVSFGDIFTNRAVRKEFRLINKGRRPHTLSWMLEEVRGRKRESAAVSTTSNSGVDSSLKRDLFTVVPSRFTIGPGEQRTIYIEAFSAVAIEDCKEMMICQCSIDKDPSKHIILGTEISATFVRPLVSLSKSKIAFHIMQESEPIPYLSEWLDLKNISSLPLRLALHTTSPFEVVNTSGKTEYVLLPGEEERVEIRFCTINDDEKVSYEIFGKLLISYLEHPHKDQIDLIGKKSYPNIYINSDEIDFQSVQVGTEHKKTFTIVNKGIMRVNFDWCFDSIEESVDDCLPTFDIYPLQGYLEPGESQDMELSFFSADEGEYNIHAICRVAGGPSYCINVKSQASSIAFDFDSWTIDFGKLLYLDVAEKSFNICNTGSVPFSFHAFVPQSSNLFNRVLLSPEKSYVAPNSKQKISIKFCPCIPDLVDSFFVVQVAHFEPSRVRVKGHGMFSFVRFSLPTYNAADYQKFIEEATKNVLSQNLNNNMGITGDTLTISSITAALSGPNSGSNIGHPYLGTNPEVNNGLADNIETEAIRLMVREKVTAMLQKIAPSHKMFLQSRMEANKANNRLFKAAAAKNGTEFMGAEGFTGLSIVDYVYDFGTVVRNTVKRKSVRVTNFGPMPITFMVDKNALFNSNFSIEPEKVRQLPSQESVEMQIIYNAKAGADSSKSEVHVPVMIANGSTVTLILKATMVVPDLQVSASSLDFGDLALGRRKFISFQLSNTNSVPCDWSASLIYYEGGNNEKKRRRKTDSGTDDFKLVPKEGILQGDEKVEVTLCFSPTKPRRYEYELHLKFGTNIKPTVLPVSALAYKPLIRIDPVTMSLPPVLPYSEPSEVRFFIENPTNHPVEIFSVDFDRQFRDEEEIISKLDFPASGVLYTSPRVLGEGLPQDLISLYNKKIRAQSAGAQSESGNSVSSDVNPIIIADGQKAENVPRILATGPPLNIIFHGPPLSGKTSQARKIADAFHLTLIRFDEFVEKMISSGSAGGATHLPHLVSSGVMGSGALHQSSNGIGAHLGKSLFAPVTDDEYSVVEHPLPEDLMAEIVAARLSQQDALNGFVIDGLDSKYCARPFSVFKEILKNIPEKKNTHLVILDVPRAVMLSRKNSKKQQLMKQEKDQLAQLEALTEDDFEAMTEDERADFEQKLKILKRKIKDSHAANNVNSLHHGSSAAVGSVINDEDLEDKITDNAVSDEDANSKDTSKKKKGNQKGESSSPKKGAPTKPTKGGLLSPKTARKQVATTNITTANNVPTQSDDQEEALTSTNFEERTIISFENFVRSKMEIIEYVKEQSNISSVVGNNVGGNTNLAAGGPSNAATTGLGNGSSENKKNNLLNANSSLQGKDEKRKKEPKQSISVPNPSIDVSNANSALEGDENNIGGPHLPIDGNYIIDVAEVDGCQAEPDINKKVLEYLPSVDLYQPIQEPKDVFVSRNYVEEVVHCPAPIEHDQSSSNSKNNFVLHIETTVPLSSANNAEMNVNSLPTENFERTGSASSNQNGTVPLGNPRDHSNVSSPGKKKVTIPAPKQSAVDENNQSNTGNTNSVISKAFDFENATDRKDFRYRWILKAKEKKIFVLKYFALDVGKFDSTLHFQCVGAPKDIYELRVSGQSIYSYINFDYKRVFPRWRKQREDASILHKEYIVTGNTFEFGPLSINRPKEKNIDKMPDNRAVLKIGNNSPMPVKVYFCFRYDSKGEQFLIEPSSMDLLPGTEQDLNIWAYPKAAGKFDDALLILVRDNPEVFTVKVSCFGVRPELEADKKNIAFDRLLLQRVDQKELKIRNPTIMSAGWKLIGWDLLGEEFEVTPVEGIIEYGKETIVNIKFKAIKPVVIKRAIRLEVYDLERIGNPVQSENIVISAEAYDTSVDTHFPKGSEGGLDFGILRVFDESKQGFTLKNRGKYETGFKFIFESRDLADFFSISPSSGILVPSDKTFPIQVIFKALKEIAIKDNLSLKCLITEPTTSEVIASIPIRINAKSVFSKFSILPARDLNFQSLVYGSKSNRQIMIENMGEFDFKFTIARPSAQDESSQQSHGKAVGANLTVNSTGTGAKTNVSKSPNSGLQAVPPMSKGVSWIGGSVKQDGSAPFIITPLVGSIAPGSKQAINVEFHPDVPGLYEELLLIDISDRGPGNGGESGHEYRLIGECCMPGINTHDFSSIFEENSVRKRLDPSHPQSFVYVEDEKVFYFGAFLVGQVAQTRFKISNPFKVPCEVTVSAKPRVKNSGAPGANASIGINSSGGGVSNKASANASVTNSASGGSAGGDNQDFAFEVEPKKLILPSHEHRFVIVSFHPTAIQAYQGIFEALVESVPDGRSKALQFEIKGEGTLPRISIERPLLKSKNGATSYPLLKFKRTLVGVPQNQVVLVKNEGIIPAKIKFDWLSLDSNEFDFEGINSVHQLIPSETRAFNVKFRAQNMRKLDTEVRLRVIDNAFEDTMIQFQAEAYLEDLSLEGLPNESENEMNVEDCFIDETRTTSFNLRNNTNSYVRFSWTHPNEFTFSPQIGHIKPFGIKNMVVTFHPKSPVKQSQIPCTCNSIRIKYVTNVSSETDWDDRIKTIRWAYDHENGSGSSRGETKKVVESVPEPSHQILDGTAFNLSMPISYTADYSEYECDVHSLTFKTTLMYQTRTYSFPLKNTGKVKLFYRFQFFDETGLAIPDGLRLPFTVIDPEGIILPGESSLIVVKFHPEEVGNYVYNLVGFMQNLPKGKTHLHFQVKGSSLRPFCHFELEAKDYLLSERRSMESFSAAPSTLDPATRVMEIESVGIKSKNIKRFYILNPTSFTYDFEWINESSAEISLNTLRCLTPKGTIVGGKKFEIIFEFMPENVDVLESFWKFSIPQHNILVPFLMICRAIEPNIYMDKTNFNFKSVLINCTIKEKVKLINNESIPLNFSFNDFLSESGGFGNAVLNLNPVQGTIQPKSELPIHISFTPNSEKVYNYNLVCSVKKKPTPLVLNVKGEGYIIHEFLEGEKASGETFELSPTTAVQPVINSMQTINSKSSMKGKGVTSSVDDPNHNDELMLSNNILDFGMVYINERQARRVKLHNGGKFNFDFAWKIIGPRSASISINPEIGSVAKDETIICEIQFNPVNVFSLRGVSVICQIINGQSYKIDLDGKCVKPNIIFSELHHDFGPFYLFKPGMKPLEHKFKLTNKDQREFSFDAVVSDNNAFEVQTTPSALAPGATGTVSVFFYPREVKKYEEKVTVDLNGVIKTRLSLHGEGVEMKVDLASIDTSKNVTFGAVRVGHAVTKTLKIANRGIIPTKFSLGPAGTLDSLRKKFVTISPYNDLVVRPKGFINVDLKFSPNQRVQPFSEEIWFECPGYNRQFFTLSGTCHGVEIRLENDIISFGAVVQRSSATRRIQLQNIGDIGVKFKWDVAKFQPDFSISPPEGYISSGMEIPLDIVFHPKDINADIRIDSIPCFIEGSNPLYLGLTGMCVPPIMQNDIIKFSVPVRESETKTITIANKNPFAWNLKPVVDHEFWKCPDSIDIEPGQTKQLEVSYTPLEMSTGDQKHEGAVFIPMPDGSGLLFRLLGSADKPLPSGTITREVACKSLINEVLLVKNWLKKAQRFKVTLEQIHSPTGNAAVATSSSSISLKGHTFLDVPANGSKDYKLGFFAFKEGLYNIKVTFKNETTQEYAYYLVNFKCVLPALVPIIDLSTISRQPVIKEITINNPLNTAASFMATCQHPDISVTPSFVVAPRSDGICTIEFLPLQAKESVTRLTLTSNELGVYQYDLKLTSTPAGAERSLLFKVGLGGNQTQTFRFISYCKSRTEYMCRIDSPDFSVDKTVSVPPAISAAGVEVGIDIQYEPSKLGDTRTVLNVSSLQGGDYICPLFGHCVQPKPLGPFHVKPGATVSIPFKNVSSQQAVFNFSIDNPNFSVKNQEAIGPKKTIHINVACKLNNPKAPKTSKLVVTQVGGSVSWTYYLKALQ